MGCQPESCPLCIFLQLLFRYPTIIKIFHSYCLLCALMRIDQ